MATHRFARPHGLAAAGVEGAAGNCDIRSVDVSDDFWTDAGVSIIAVLALPFYLGYIHAPIDSMIEYAIVAGFGLALGERLAYAFYRHDNHPVSAFHAGLTHLAGLVWEGFSFVIA